MDVKDTSAEAGDNRGIHHHIVTALGGRPAHGTAALTAQAYDVLAGEAAERGRTPVLIIDLCRARNYADTLVAGGAGKPCAGGLLEAAAGCAVGIVTGFRGRPRPGPAACNALV